MKSQHKLFNRLQPFLLAGGVAVLFVACLPPAVLQTLLDFNSVEMQSRMSCEELEQNLKARALREAELRASNPDDYNPTGFVAAGAKTLADQSTSTTNNQEKGVDEADIFKVDGQFAYALHGNALVIVEAMSEGSQGGRQVSWTTIEGQPFEMFVEGDRALVLLRTNFQEIKGHFNTDSEDPKPAGTTIPERKDELQVVKAALYNISDREKPSLIRELFVEGEYISARRIGNKAYIVARALLEFDVDEEMGNPEDGFEDIEDASNWIKDRRNAINGAKLSTWLPHYYDVRYNADGTVSQEAAHCSCENTYTSPSSVGDDALAIYTIELGKGEHDVETSVVIGDGGVVYSSKKSLVVAMTNYAEQTYDAELDNGFGSTEGQLTWLHQFNLNESGKVSYDASGQVDGWILGQFSMSEYKNTLRIATMVGYHGSFDVQTNVYALQAFTKNNDTELSKTRGQKDRYLKVVGELTGIGYGEDIYAVRFKEDVGYVVTFRETDPLWVIDFADPGTPKLRGHLEVPGYSTYLHPINGNALIGIGRYDWANGDGIKLSLFNTSDLDNPTATQELTVGDYYSDSEVFNTHKAFTWLEDLGIMAIPVNQDFDGGLMLYKVEPNQGFTLQGTISHSGLVDDATGISPSVLRSHRIGNHIYSYSRSGISINAIDTLETVAAVDLDDI